MPTKQKVILLILVLLSALQQGFRWYINSKEVSLDPPTAAVVQAAEPAQFQTHNHCPLVHVNSAGMAELQTLPGIGPVYAERIIQERKERPFLEKHDLLRVSGIGEKRLSQIVHLICLYYEEDAETK
ncbi:MAG: helix-hairpin-helix domain-containing protein [Firmicutes bacterium]|nr:helix-hairpin-helix domain-containing protein [Bacillota bacterium]